MFERLRRLRAPLLAGTVSLLALAISPAQAGQPSTARSGTAASAAAPNATPGDILARMAVVLDELEAIRVEMGRPPERRPLGTAHGMGPHEAYFQALTLYLKADRLALELTGSTGLPPAVAQPRDVRAQDVADVVAAAHQRLLTVMAELGLAANHLSRNTDPQATLTDVGYAILRANRQINLLLERRFTPSDAHQQVNVAIGYARALLDRFPGVQSLPPAPPFDRGKTPGDVFARLLECYQRLHSVARSSNVAVLHIDSVALGPDEVLPSDVYDLATLLVSDLAYFHAQGTAPRQPAPVPYHGRKFPSHVYQQAGILAAQLALLDTLAKKDPDWLAR